MEQSSRTDRLPPLSVDESLYRSLLTGRAVNWKRVHPATGNHLTPAAFMRRPPHPDTGKPRDSRGLSVNLAGGRSEAATLDAIRDFLNPLAVCRLTVEQAKSVSGTRLPDETAVTVEVVQDKRDHALLVGLPEVLEANPTSEAGRKATADAEFIGGKLATLAAVVWRK